ncbi:MAG: aminopeptidase N [Alphaproteobacteria bacterium]|nr:aminopeptidase N [Alphaproteobacteria bacterium]
MTVKYRKDYVAPHYRLPKTELDFTLHPTKTVVKAKLSFDGYDVGKPLVLNGEYMTLKDIKMAGKKLAKKDYKLDAHTLTLNPKQKKFTIETTVEINPTANTRLFGLYASDGMLCTQNEPEGFRSITYYPDHSDVLSHWIVTIHADRKKWPVVLSNGNKIKETGNTVVFDDPFAKPSYLFALVAGKLDSIHDTFKTKSGKVVKLGLYCESGKKDRLHWAMEALKKAMAWDEKRFGLEYDLKSFNIVAVSHFNAGAMENKSLNIYNDAALLASKDTATDATFEYIEHVVGHEYFHNYSGDRVTLRSWFELSLKEGFTVYRDEEFGYDVRSRAVGRIDDAVTLRTFQYPEDDGPLAHPVRPDSYQEIDNFYTTTIYEKGAEVIRMQQAIVGDKAFQKGCDIYFKRHDGQAVTIDDFVKAIEDGSKTDLTQFKQWYSVAGRPTVSVDTKWNKGTFTVTLSQSHKKCKTPFVIPLKYGLVGSDGKDMKKGTFVLKKKSESFEFKGLKEKPVLSINRALTAPVDIKIEYGKADRLRLMTYDSDLFNRYDVGQQYALESMVDMATKKSFKPDLDVIKALGSYLSQPRLDKAFLARAIILPTEGDMMMKMKTVSVETLKKVRRTMREAFAKKYEKELLKIYQGNQVKGLYSPETVPAAKRALKNVALGYLALTKHADLVWEQYRASDNLTDRLSALGILVNQDLPHKKEALDAFYKRYDGDDLVLNKWFVLQAMEPTEKALDTVKKLIKHPVFDYKNPNKVRALIGAFGRNLTAFNRADGKGYDFYVTECSRLDEINPKITSNLLTAFSKFKKFDKAHQEKARKALQKLLKQKGLSINAKETIERILA